MVKRFEQNLNKINKRTSLVVVVVDHPIVVAAEVVVVEPNHLVIDPIAVVVEVVGSSCSSQQQVHPNSLRENEIK